jgi:hypothetical protein
MRAAVIGFLAAAPLMACGGGLSLSEPSSPSSKNAPQPEPGQKFDAEHRWEIADPIAVKKLQGTPFGEQEINEFWVRKGWRLTKHEERYLATVAELVRQAKITKISHWGQTPFEPIYQTLQRITLEGVTIEPQTEFRMDFNENQDELKVAHPRFLRINEYEEEHQGHSDQASDGHVGEQHPGGHHDHDHHDD